MILFDEFPSKHATALLLLSINRLQRKLKIPVG